MFRMQIYSKDLRIRAVKAVERGIPRKEVVEIFSISLTTLKRWIKIRREGKDLSPGVSTGRRRRILSSPEEEGLLWEQLEANDDATLQRHCELWEQKTGVRVSVSAMSRAIRQKLGWSYKKRRWVPPSETNKRSVASMDWKMVAIKRPARWLKLLASTMEARQAASTRLWSRLAPWSITRFSPYATSSVPMRINSPYSPEHMEVMFSEVELPLYGVLGSSPKTTLASSMLRRLSSGMKESMPPSSLPA